MIPSELKAAFFAKVGGSLAATSLEEDLAQRLAEGRQAWPDLMLGDASFVSHLAAHAEGGELPPREYSRDLFLACACAVGTKGAAAAFERNYRSVLEHAVARVNRRTVDEGTQVVLVSLLVAEPPNEPRIATYSGRSTLRTWLTTVATRATLKLHRRRDDQAHESIGGLVDAFVAEEPELKLAKARHGPDLEASLRAALGELEPRHLVLLRLHHAEGWSVDRLGGLYRVGRSTAARWVAAARGALLDGTKGHLRARLSLTPTELESLIALLRSNIQVSLVRLLEDEADALPSDSAR
jgi:RNA polymerase sigma-70 factor (ECF subfamily)